MNGPALCWNLIVANAMERFMGEANSEDYTIILAGRDRNFAVVCGNDLLDYTKTEPQILDSRCCTFTDETYGETFYRVKERS